MLEVYDGWRITKHEEPCPNLPKCSDWHDNAEDDWEAALDKATAKIDDCQRRYDEAAIIIYNSCELSVYSLLRGIEDPFAMWNLLAEDQNTATTVTGRLAIANRSSCKDL